MRQRSHVRFPGHAAAPDPRFDLPMVFHPIDEASWCYPSNPSAIPVAPADPRSREAARRTARIHRKDRGAFPFGSGTSAALAGAASTTLPVPEGRPLEGRQEARWFLDAGSRRFGPER